MNARSIRFRTVLWYSAVLATSMLICASAVYLGLEKYLDWSLKTSLLEQAHSIAEKLLVDVERKGEQYVVGEINEGYSPEITSRFIRITRSDSSILYLSSPPADRSFDAPAVPKAESPAGKESGRRVHLNNNSSLVLETVSYTSPGGQHFIVDVGAPYHQIATVLRGLLITFALGAPILIAIAMAGGYLVMRRALRPVSEIASHAERISSRNMAERLPVLKTGDELEQLSTSLNTMMSRLEESFQHISRFSADVSHELRTPLTILRGELETLAADRKCPGQMLEGIGSALEEIERMSDIVENLLAISRLDAGEAILQIGRVELGSLAVSTAEQMRLLAEEKLVSIRYCMTDRVEVAGDAARLRQVIVNLLNNAIMYTPAGGCVELATMRRHNMGVLQVIDNGIGISAESLPFVFERFYRSDKARSRSSGGAGLGLTIVKAICTAHNGDVQISAGMEGGTCVQVSIPLAERVAGETPEAVTPEWVGTASARAT